MNKLIAILAALLFATGAYARGGHGGASHSSGGGHSSVSRGGNVHVNGYTTKSGKYVAPHMRSAPDHTQRNNWSTKGNVNPYTGKKGTKKVNH